MKQIACGLKGEIQNPDRGTGVVVLVAGVVVVVVVAVAGVVVAVAGVVVVVPSGAGFVAVAVADKPWVGLFRQEASRNVLWPVFKLDAGLHIPYYTDNFCTKLSSGRLCNNVGKNGRVG